MEWVAAQTEHTSKEYITEYVFKKMNRLIIAWSEHSYYCTTCDTKTADGLSERFGLSIHRPYRIYSVRSMCQ